MDNHSQPYEPEPIVTAHPLAVMPMRWSGIQPGVSQCPPEPIRANGGDWAVTIIDFEGRRKIWAACEGWAVAGLMGVPGTYDDMSLHDRLVTRIRFAVARQCWLQARLNSEAQANGDWTNRLTEGEREILNGRRDVQPTWAPEPSLFGTIEPTWSAPVPLIAVSTGYVEPGETITGDTRPVAPVGELVWWIDPTTDMTLLDSLAALNQIDLWIDTGAYEDH